MSSTGAPATPILPVTEEPAPRGAIEGDHTAPTQPVSALSFKPPPLHGARYVGRHACSISSPAASRFQPLRYEGRYTPPSMQGSLVYPGNFGAFNWGGVAVDPVRQVMFGMPTYLAFTSQLVPRKDDTDQHVSDGKPGFNGNDGAPYAA